MESKLDWYKKLAVKLNRIERGELSLSDYIKEVDDKINRLGPPKRRPFFKGWNWGAFAPILLLAFVGALTNKSVHTWQHAVILALAFGVPVGLLFAWISKSDNGNK